MLTSFSPVYLAGRARVRRGDSAALPSIRLYFKHSDDERQATDGEKQANCVI
jgi:hypothetical protein